jgi:hypothetical protein
MRPAESTTREPARRPRRWPAVGGGLAAPPRARRAAYSGHHRLTGRREPTHPAPVTSLPEMRRFAPLARATLFAAALLLPTTASAHSGGLSREAVLDSPPKVSSFGNTSEHVCLVDGAYQKRPGGRVVALDASDRRCARKWAPIPVEVGHPRAGRVRDRGVRDPRRVQAGGEGSRRAGRAGAHSAARALNPRQLPQSVISAGGRARPVRTPRPSSRRRPARRKRGGSSL